MWRRKNDLSSGAESSRSQDTSGAEGGGKTQASIHQEWAKEQRGGGTGHHRGRGYHRGGVTGWVQNQPHGPTKHPQQQQQHSGIGQSSQPQRGGTTQCLQQQGQASNYQQQPQQQRNGGGKTQHMQQQQPPQGPQKQASYHKQQPEPQQRIGGGTMYQVGGARDMLRHQQSGGGTVYHQGGTRYGYHQKQQQSGHGGSRYHDYADATGRTPQHLQPQQRRKKQRCFGHESESSRGKPSDDSLSNQKESAASPKYPPRPDKGLMGRRCLVKANHFVAELEEKDLHQYSISFTPEVTSKRISRAIMSQLVETYRVSHLGNRLPAYDGSSNLYTAGNLPFISKEFDVTLTNNVEKELQFKVVMRLASRLDSTHMREFFDGTPTEQPQAAINVLDIVLRQRLLSSTSNYVPMGRSFFSRDFSAKKPLGEGLESWRGFYYSTRPTQMGFSLNIDISSTAFIKAQPVMEFVAELLNTDITNKMLSKDECSKILKGLKGVKVKVMHQVNRQRQYKVSGLTEKLPHELMFTAGEEGKMTSMVDYFRDIYQYNIQHIHLPCLQVNNPKRRIYLPMEVCEIVDGQRCTQKLSPRQVTSFLKSTCQRPAERQTEIAQIARENDYENDPYAKEFGVRVNDELATIEARILPPPRLQYHRSGIEQDCLPQVGQWNMINKKFINGATVENWICISFDRHVDRRGTPGFCHKLVHECNLLGMKFNPEPVLPQIQADPERVERELKNYCMDAMAELQERALDLLIVILPDNNGPLYGEIKRICETDIGITSQCCLAKNALRCNQQFLANLALKINVKVGGRNTVLVDALSKRGIPFVTDRPTIIFGADVNHPPPGEDSAGSIAAVVASRDWPEITTYACLVSAQPHRQELIDDLFTTYEDADKGTVTGGMIQEHLLAFRRETGHKPERIIFYRDGVSQGQFSQVLLHEIDAIRKACDSLESDYQPPITFVLVQKRHHTRLFPYDHQQRGAVDKSGNILPGTVVDTKICHPREFDFYLCSHAGVQGTSKAAHYHVLWDENKFTSDGLQSLTYNLCYSFARCTRSVSIVPPVYYADLAAFRARFYVEKENSSTAVAAVDTENPEDIAAVAQTMRVQAADATVKKLPAVKGNVKNVMYYC